MIVGLSEFPDEEWGEKVAAAVVSDSDALDFSSMRKWLEERIPKYRIPRLFIQVDALPRNTLGKVTKNELKPFFLSDHTDNS